MQFYEKLSKETENKIRQEKAEKARKIKVFQTRGPEMAPKKQYEIIPVAPCGATGIFTFVR